MTFTLMGAEAPGCECRSLVARGIASLVLGSAALVAAAATNEFRPSFPRLMGMNIGAKHYDDPEYQAALARYDVVILSFFADWRKGRGAGDPIKQAVAALKAHNPSLLVGQYTIFTEARRDGREKAQILDQHAWWLRDADGRHAQWTTRYNAYEINITEWVQPDAQGRRFNEWLIERDHKLYHRDRGFDIWYLDNSGSKPMVRSADWDLSGKNSLNTDARIASAHRRAHARGWDYIRKLQPDALLIGNTNDVSSPEYSGKLNGAFMEALIGKTWSIETRGGFEAVMSRYRRTMEHVAAPRLVGFGVSGQPNDYRLMRYGLAACLMHDGYFAYSSVEGQYGTATWFDEFDVDLGQAVEAPPAGPWQKGVYKREFERGLALVNPSSSSVEVKVPRGYRRFSGRQEPEINNGQTVDRVTLGPKDGLILVRDERTPATRVRK